MPAHTRSTVYDLPPHLNNLLNRNTNPPNHTHTHTTPTSSSTPITARKMSSAAKVPAFSGNEDFGKWLKSFEQAMLIMDFEDNSPKMAKLFYTCVQDGSSAASWLSTIPAPTRSQWTDLLPLLKARFETDTFTKENATRAFLGLRLLDAEVGEPGEKGIEKQIIFINKAVDLAAKCTMDTATAKLCILERMGYEIRSLVQRSNPPPTSLQEIQTIILHLTASDIYHVRKEVRRQHEDHQRQQELVELRNARILAPMNGGFARQALSPPQYPANPANPPSGPRPSGPATGANAATINIPSGPFPDDPAGQAQYRNAVTLFYQKFGQGATSGMARPFPLSPGTLPVGSFECWSCGKSGHMRQNCTGPFVPENEQRFRGIASQPSRKNTSSQPVRMVSNGSTPYDSPTPPTPEGYPNAPDYYSETSDYYSNPYDQPPHLDNLNTYISDNQGNDWESKW